MISSVLILLGRCLRRHQLIKIKWCSLATREVKKNNIFYFSEVSFMFHDLVTSLILLVASQIPESLAFQEAMFIEQKGWWYIASFRTCFWF